MNVKNHGEGSTYPKKTLQVYSTCIECSMKMIDRVLYGIILSNEINESNQ